MAETKPNLCNIWRPFKPENYRWAWGEHKIFGVLRQFVDDLKYTYRRARYGYCECDLWSIDSWFLDIMPRMIEEHKATRHGSPLLNEADLNNDEAITKAWDEILDKLIFLFREASEDTCTKVNPYEAEFYRISEEFRERFGECGEKLMTDEERHEAEYGHSHRVHFADEVPEYKEICDKYFDEDRKIAEYRVKCKDEAFELFRKYFHDLWD